MAQPANPRAMSPAKPARTRAAAPMKPGNWPSSSRYRTYLAFDFTGVVYLVAGLLIVRAIFALAGGEASWNAEMATYASSGFLIFHAFALACVIFVGVRFFRLFPKAQPPKIGPASPPPRPVLHAALYVVWIGVTLVLGAILGGAIL